MFHEEVININNSMVNKLLYKLIIRRKQLEKEERKRINERNEYINSILEKFNWVSGIKSIFKKKNKNIEENNYNIVDIEDSQIDENKGNIEE